MASTRVDLVWRALEEDPRHKIHTIGHAKSVKGIKWLIGMIGAQKPG
jgi:hypothetical protein